MKGFGCCDMFYVCRSYGARHPVAEAINMTLLTELERQRRDMFIDVTMKARSSVRSGTIA